MGAYEKFVKTIASVLNDEEAFSCCKSSATGESDKETKTKEKISRAYKAFATKCKFSQNFTVRGMRSGLGALTDAPPDDYLISTKDESIEIWIGFDDKSNKRVQIRIRDSRKASRDRLSKLITSRGITVNLSSRSEQKKAIKQYWEDYKRLDDTVDFRH